MALTNHILTIIEPTIKLDEYRFKSYGEEEGKANTSLAYGAGDEPLVIINGYTFNEGDIKSLEIDVSGKIPELNLVIVDTNGQFGIDTFPRDGDVVSVRIQPRQKDVYRNIRIDFDIDEVDAPPSNSIQKGLGGAVYTFSGAMKIPGMFAETCKTFEVGNSLDHLESIVTELGLGLATNVEAPDDSMNLVIAYDSYLDTIENRVQHSYVGESSFQTFAIDPYYYLNYVDINSLLESPEDIEKVLANFDQNLEDVISNQLDNKTNEQEANLILTTHSKAEGTNMHITAYTLKNNAGTAVKLNGYKRVLQYFENDSEEGLVSFDVEPMTSSKLKDIEEPLKGRRDEERYKQEVKYKYMGRIDTDPETSNTHLNYNFARIHNKQNMDELYKMTLEVELSAFNPGIHRFQKLPIIIFNQTQAQVNADNALKRAKKDLNFDAAEEHDSKDQLADPSTVDEFLTGFYVIGGIKYRYSNRIGRITQVLTLLRREWPSRLNNIR